jgi:hypothetical protein
VLFHLLLYRTTTIYRKEGKSIGNETECCWIWLYIFLFLSRFYQMWMTSAVNHLLSTLSGFLEISSVASRLIFCNTRSSSSVLQFYRIYFSPCNHSGCTADWPWLHTKNIYFFFLKDPIYLQSVTIHSANGGKGEGWHVEEYSVELLC